jgi:hypothetical protein
LLSGAVAVPAHAAVAEPCGHTSSDIWVYAVGSTSCATAWQVERWWYRRWRAQHGYIAPYYRARIAGRTWVGVRPAEYWLAFRAVGHLQVDINLP